jgi:hypothetical protein
VVLFGGGGSLLLKDTHAAKARGISKASRARRIAFPFNNPDQICCSCWTMRSRGEFVAAALFAIGTY